MAKNELTRRQVLQWARAGALGALAVSSISRSAFSQGKPSEPWEAYIDEELKIEVGPTYFQVAGQERNSPIALKIGKIYLLVFRNSDKGVLGPGVPHGAHLGKDPNLDQRHYNSLLMDNFYAIELEGGEEGEIIIKAPDKPGEWEMGCFVAGHYEAGQHAAIILEP